MFAGVGLSHQSPPSALRFAFASLIGDDDLVAGYAGGDFSQGGSSRESVGFALEDAEQRNILRSRAHRCARSFD